MPAAASISITVYVVTGITSPDLLMKIYVISVKKEHWPNLFSLHPNAYLFCCLWNSEVQQIAAYKEEIVALAPAGAVDLEQYRIKFPGTKWYREKALSGD